MARQRIPGLSVAAFTGGSLAWARAYGLADTVTGVPMTTDTRLQAASISKVLTSIAALRLVDQGMLELDSDVNLRLRRWKVPRDGGWQPRVTLRELLSHTAGTAVPGFEGSAAGDPVPTLPQLLAGEHPANSSAIRVVKLPRGRFDYSGGGIEIVQALIEDVTGKSFPDAMEDLALRPIGMTSSTFAQPLGSDVPRASGHAVNGSQIAGRYHLYPEMAAAGLWTTPSDLGKVCMALSRARAGSPDAILSPARFDDMLTDVSGASYGLGISLTTRNAARAVWHDGANAGFGAEILCLLDTGDAVAVMTNRDFGPIHEQVLAAVETAEEWDATKPRVATEPEISSAVGRYRSVPRGAWEARWSSVGLERGGDGGLVLKLAEQPPLPLVETTTDTFIAADLKGLSVHLRRQPGAVEGSDKRPVMGIWMVTGNVEDYFTRVPSQ